MSGTREPPPNMRSLDKRIDLQLLDSEEEIDMATVGATATRLFAARRNHAWPPEVIAYEGWDTLYAEAADGLDVLPTIDEAVSWANDFIARATSSG